MIWLKFTSLIALYAVLAAILVAMGRNAFRSIRTGNTDYIQIDFLVMGACFLVGGVFFLETKKVVRELWHHRK